MEVTEHTPLRVLSDEDMNRAATKIQAQFRGYRVRQSLHEPSGLKPPPGGNAHIRTLANGDEANRAKDAGRIRESFDGMMSRETFIESSDFMRQAREREEEERRLGEPEAAAAEAVAEPVTSKRASNAAGAPAIQTTQFDALEKEIKALVKSREDLLKFWRTLDGNGNNIVSLAELDKLVEERFPLLNSKTALMRAFKKTVLRDGDGDAWVDKEELPFLLRNLFYFNKVFSAFRDMDKDGDRRLNLAEFRDGAKKLGLKLSDVELKTEFDNMDSNAGGMVG
jgi:Ca2+-binding EF-hand superfamily protein